jgi:hypothetical protein
MGLWEAATKARGINNYIIFNISMGLWEGHKCPQVILVISRKLKRKRLGYGII